MSLKDGIERALGLPVRLRAGAPGSLAVSVDGKQIYSKKQSGRMPTSDELVALIRSETATT